MGQFHDFTENLDSFFKLSSEGVPVAQAWRECVEARAPLIYENIVYQFGGFTSEDVTSPASMPDTETNKRKVVIFKRVYEKVANRFSLPLNFVDAYILPTQFRIPCLTGVFPSLSQKPICLMSLDGFDKRLDLFELVSFHELVHAAQMYHGFHRVSKTDDGPLFEPLWNEGMAEFISYTEVGAHFEEETEKISAWATEFLNQMDLSIIDNSTVYQQWFSSSATAGAIGYSLGFSMFKQLSKIFDISELVKMQPTDYRDIVIVALKKMIN